MEGHANLSRAAFCSPPGFDGLIGESCPMRRLYEIVTKVSQTSSPVLLQGETGTGKELVARCIHFKGPRQDNAFVPIDCSALAPTLVESELFGHIRGAFTGADHPKQGLLQAANRGTVFLDEIGEFPEHLQAKLLRALQEKEIRPVGSTERIPVNARIISATNRDLEAEVQKGTFRKDLFYRLNVVQITLPPLRQRRADIPLLVAHFLKKFSDPPWRVPAISSEALRRLIAYDWPGNVRELQNAVEAAVALTSHNTLTADDISSAFTFAPGEGVPDENDLVPLIEMEWRAIMRALRETRGKKLPAARLLGIGKTTLYRKLREYGHKP